MESSDWQRLKKQFHAVLDSPESGRAAVLENIDADLRREVEKLIAAHENAGDFIAEPAMVEVGLAAEAETDFYVGKQIDSYKILREIGHGGMGTVYLAARADDFERQVAVKLIKRGMDTSAVLKRFVMERQILARLEHPNIASLFDGGSTPDGLPYLVMEYVKGQPITKFCDLHQFDTTERLKLFREICSAVSYAHQNLVVHRDLKPSNILVTAEGVPKLLDFGIATLLHPGWSLETGEATSAIFRLMTPEYASPEQLRDLPITTASDVYSLGVVLYELLTGRRPYEIESRLPEEAAQIVLTAEPVKPSDAVTRRRGDTANLKSGGEFESDESGTSLTTDKFSAAAEAASPAHGVSASQLKGDLDNIILKALRKEPERRYASVQEMAEDIRRHLAALPVAATSDTSLYRAGKFVKRHRLGVFAGLLIALTLFSATTITTWQSIVARRDQAKAERRFNELRQLSNSLLTETYDSLTAISGTARTQKLLAEKSLTLLESLAQDETQDVKLLGELASAYIKVGQLQSAALDDGKTALQSFRKGVETHRRRLLLAPDDAAIKKDLVFGLFKVSEVLSSLGKYGEFLEVADEIIRIQQEEVAAVTDAAPHNPKLLESLAGSYRHRGEFLKAWNHPDEARADLERAADLMAQAVNQLKETAFSPEEKVSLSFTYLLQGSLFESLREWQKAAESYRTAGTIAEAVYRENPSMTQALRNTTSSRKRLGDVLAELGDHQAALENYRYALKFIKDARAKDQSDLSLRYAEAVFEVKVANALEKTGAKEEALKMVESALGLVRRTISDNADRSNSIIYTSELLQQIADFYASINRPEQALEILHEARGSFEKATLESSTNALPNGRLAVIYAKIGDLYFGRNNPSDARRWYEKSLAIWQDLQQNGTLSDANKPDEVKRKIKECETALTKLPATE